MKSMRVLHWYPNFLAGGGVANAVLGLVNAQAQLGVDVFVATAEASGNALYGPVIDHLRPEVKLIRWKPSWTLQLGLTMRGMPSNMSERAVDVKPDVVHIHGEFNPDNLRVPRLFECPIIVSPHGAFHPVVLRKSKRWLKGLYIAMAERLLYRSVIFHALSPAERGHVVGVLPGARVYVAPQGPSLQMEAFLDKAKPSRNVSFAPIRFLFVGRLDVYTKGLDMLLQAFALARPRVHREALLVLVGPEWNGCMSVLTNLIKAVRLEEHVNIAGIRMGSDLAEMFDQSHIYIHVSRHEGHPSAVTEALLWGKPAILTSTIGTTSYPEIAYLSHVLVVPPRVDDIANSMIRAMACIEELQRNACENRLKVGEFFSWNRAAREHINRYQEVSKERLGE